mmetsp:Transcript_137669/g.427695  ORF Transcript_137669/g.427695 Transcript_137669/m.427695 type:complete len:259 (+) Transcript_137669:375-1151(+)
MWRPGTWSGACSSWPSAGSGTGTWARPWASTCRGRGPRPPPGARRRASRQRTSARWPGPSARWTCTTTASSAPSSAHWRTRPSWPGRRSASSTRCTSRSRPSTRSPTGSTSSRTRRCRASGSTTGASAAARRAPRSAGSSAPRSACTPTSRSSSPTSWRTPSPSPRRTRRPRASVWTWRPRRAAAGGRGAPRRRRRPPPWSSSSRSTGPTPSCGPWTPWTRWEWATPPGSAAPRRSSGACCAAWASRWASWARTSGGR